jgi:hypothetical protein
MKIQWPFKGNGSDPKFSHPRLTENSKPTRKNLFSSGGFLDIFFIRIICVLMMMSPLSLALLMNLIGTGFLFSVKACGRCLGQRFKRLKTKGFHYWGLKLKLSSTQTANISKRKIIKQFRVEIIAIFVVFFSFSVCFMTSQITLVLSLHLFGWS